MYTTKIDWKDVGQSLNESGFAILPQFLTRESCEALQLLYDKPSLFRSIIDMKRYRFGEGEYKYFTYPLPAVLSSLRKALYAPLVETANAWMKLLNIPTSFPETHEELIEQCKAKGQTRPTPLILKYTPGGYNTLHQDLYGEVYFPFQVVFLLTQPGIDHHGGEFIIAEQIPRAQTKAKVIPLQQGDAMIFTTNFRPVKGSKGYYRTHMKHGVSEVTSGVRFSLGIIFHDAS